MTMPVPTGPEIAKSALIIVDMQNDFVHPEGGFAHRARENPPKESYGPTFTICQDAPEVEVQDSSAQPVPRLRPAARLYP